MCSYHNGTPPNALTNFDQNRQFGQRYQRHNVIGLSVGRTVVYRLAGHAMPAVTVPIQFVDEPNPLFQYNIVRCGGLGCFGTPFHTAIVQLLCGIAATDGTGDIICIDTSLSTRGQPIVFPHTVSVGDRPHTHKHHRRADKLI